MAKTFEQVKTPFQNMGFTPDVPSSALGPNEYNSGRNVEADTRGIRSVFGDQEFLDAVPGTPIYVTGGYRENDNWWYIVGTAEGYWYGSDNGDNWTEINPPDAQGGPMPGYSESMNITEGWNGSTLVINDAVNPPMFLLGNAQRFTAYSNTPRVSGPTTNVGGALEIDLSGSLYPRPNAFYENQPVVLEGWLPNQFNGNSFIFSAVDGVYTVPVLTSDQPEQIGTVRPLYMWNYNYDWITLAAQWVRVFNTPNVGAILIAGNLKTTQLNPLDLTEIIEVDYPVTVRWSQQFAIDNITQNWEPSLSNVANELEVPARGPLLDGFPTAGNFYVQSYWDTVVFSPINYQTTTIPILGVRIANVGRGLLTTNAWANADDIVVGIDSRDIWVFNGTNFKGLGNQRVKNFVLGNINPLYVDRVFLQNNTIKNQIEIYYPDFDSTGWCNKMISYRYDLDIFNAPRDVPNVASSIEGPLYTEMDDSTIMFDNSYRTVVYCRGVENSKLIQKDQGFAFIDGPIQSEFRRDNILLLPKYSQQLMVHRILPEVYNLDQESLVTTSTGNVNITVGGSNSVGETPTFKNTVVYPVGTNDPWIQVNQNVFRTNSIKIAHSSETDCWICVSINWQYNETQDAL